MKRVLKFQEALYDNVITEEFDRIIPVVGDEGMGKSTFILQFTWFWQDILGYDATIENVLDTIVWGDVNDFKRALANVQERQIITVMDAARVMNKKDAMSKDQKEIEKDLFDVRMKENVILLGYQDWKTIPTVLQTRRAKNMFYIPKRGSVWGYNRKAMDKKLDDPESWPDPTLRDGFPSLEGKELWREFKKKDLEFKQERIQPEEEEEDVDLHELADEIINNGLGDVISMHGGHHKPYVDANLIELEYDVNARESKLIAKLIKRDVDVQKFYA